MKPQLALHKYIEDDKKAPKYIGRQYSVFEKYDGWYGYIEVGGDGKIKSRAGRVIPAVQHMNALFKGVPQGTYIFEILLSDVTDFSTLNGILNRSKGVCQATSAYLRLHDYIAPGSNCLPFWRRFEALCEILKNKSHLLKVAPKLANSSDPKVWERVVNIVWECGGEGIILKANDAVYEEGKRNASLMKIKEDITLDLVVVDYVEGEGKYRGTLGALVVEDSEGYQHNVSGMTDEQRHTWWKNPTEILGQIVEVKAMKRLKDGSLREPRFKAVRFDKSRDEID